MKITRVLVDAGHGPGNGKGGRFDPGASYPNRTEHAMVSDVAARLSGMLPPPLRFLRAPELPLHEVVAWVNSVAEEGDLLLSLHMNAATSEKANGTEVVVALASPLVRRAQGLLLCRELSSTLKTRNRGLKFDVETVKGEGRGLPIVRDTKCPAFLVELGFISNVSDVSAVEARGAEALKNAILALQETT